MLCDCVRLFPVGTPLGFWLPASVAVPASLWQWLSELRVPGDHVLCHCVQPSLGLSFLVMSLGAACLPASGRVAEADAGVPVAAQVHSGDAWLPCTGFCETVRVAWPVCVAGSWLGGSIGKLVL